MKLPALKVRPLLDPEFCPAFHYENYYKNLVGNSKACEVFRFGIKRNNDLIYSEKLNVSLDPDHIEITRNYLEKLLRTALWLFGGNHIVVNGDQKFCTHLKSLFSEEGERRHDIEFMEKIFSSSFLFEIDDLFVDESAAPQNSHPICIDNSGERIGIDLGASSIKICAQRDNSILFQERIKWSPSTSDDLSFHRDSLMSAYGLAKDTISTPKSIGISTAGVIIDDEIAVSSLFKGLSPGQDFRTFFKKFSREIGVPIVVVNDGEVSALSGHAQSDNSILGLSFGSDLGAGFVAPGRVGQWINELAFTTVDFNEDAPVDPWAQDSGTGGQYFSKKAFTRLSELSSNVNDVFETMGAYLAHTIPWFHRFYNFDTVLVMGGITQKDGGELILESAKRIFSECYPELASRVELSFASSENRQFRQAQTASGLVRM